jgi:hypothetical protein
MIFSLAHLSDPHLPLPPGCPPLGSLTAKQMLALAAWYRRRRHVTSPAVLDALSRDLAAHAPDHIAVTGDLVNLAWPPEFAQARHWLAALGPPDRVSVVPGNHDATRATAWPQGIGQWSPWMADDANGIAEDAAPFPYLRRRGEVAILGLSSALPTPVSCAAGRLGAAQLRRAAALLDGAARDGLFRVVLIHHPPSAPAAAARRCATARRCARCWRVTGRNSFCTVTTTPPAWWPCPAPPAPFPAWAWPPHRPEPRARRPPAGACTASRARRRAGGSPPRHAATTRQRAASARLEPGICTCRTPIHDGRRVGCSQPTARETSKTAIDEGLAALERLHDDWTILAQPTGRSSFSVGRASSSAMTIRSCPESPVRLMMML